MKLTLSRLRVLPRWVIYLIDLFCALMAVIIGFLLRFNFDLPHIATFNWLDIVLTVVLVNSCTFIIFRTFAGIIRHTSLQDAWRILVAIICSTGIYAVINAIQDVQGGAFFMPYSVILIAFLCAFAMMLLYRLIVKVIFDQLMNVNGKHIARSNVVIYGAGYAGSITRDVLQSKAKEEHLVRVVAFIEDDAYSWGTQLEGVPIHRAAPNVLDKLLSKYHFSQLVITDALQSSPNKEAIVEWCLQHKIKAQQIPPMAQWMQSGLKMKQIKDIRIEDLLNRNVIIMDDEALSMQLSDKVILITGAAGSIGSELARQVSAFGPAKVILCDQAESPLHDLFLELKEYYPELNFHPFLGDVCNRRQMEHLYNHYHPQIVFHAAAYKHVPVMERAPDMAVLNNVMGTMNMAELAVAYDVDKFVMISTDKAVNPTNVMGASKRLAEILAQSLNNYLHNTDHVNGRIDGSVKTDGHTVFITTRFGNVLGSNGSVVPWFKKLIEKGGPVTVTHPEVTRYFMTISEACQLVLQAGVMGKGGEIFVFDMGTPVKIADLASKMIQLSGLEPGTDIEIVYTGLRPGEKLYEELLAKKEDIIPTYHEKIMIAKVRVYDYPLVKRQIQKLIKTAHQGNVWEVVQMMKDMVPEYKSNNSKFEELDIANHGDHLTPSEHNGYASENI
ncbi:MAG TPA: nucleoside-diphosphate sugar epimerase/dehydratase [Chitinophagaceae bacterium]|nr:nucleoside-diphosphate sugar epimerase/dehydratase [Chitinophagaceae bacterium]